MPSLALENLDSSPQVKGRKKKVIHIEDVEDKAHSSERRDNVPSLRGSIRFAPPKVSEQTMQELPFMFKN